MQIDEFDALQLGYQEYVVINAGLTVRQHEVDVFEFILVDRKTTTKYTKMPTSSTKKES